MGASNYSISPKIPKKRLKMKNYRQKYRHNKGKLEKRVHLEVAMIGCDSCDRRTSHVYLGKIGIFRPNHLYQCFHCKSIYVSPRKLKYKKP